MGLNLFDAYFLHFDKHFFCADFVVVVVDAGGVE